MTASHPDFELIGGMLAAESPQHAASRVLDMLARGELDRARALIEARAARIAADLARELAAADE